MKSSPGGQATNPRLFYFSRLPSFRCSRSWAGCWACFANGSSSGRLLLLCNNLFAENYRLHGDCTMSASDRRRYAASCCGLISPSSHCCCSARARHAASILVYRFLAGTLLASLANCAQLSARSRYLCEWLIRRLVGELELLRRALERKTKMNVPHRTRMTRRAHVASSAVEQARPLAVGLHAQILLSSGRRVSRP